MNRLSIGVVASAVSALLGTTGYLGAQQVFRYDQNNVSLSAYTVAAANGYAVQVMANGTYVYSQIAHPAPAPQGATFHQVVDVYYDSDGNKLDTKSYTHAVDLNYCQPGQRRQQEDLIAQDDGKGNVRFAQTRLPSEPMSGVTPVTAEGRIRALAAISRSATETAPTSKPIELAERQ